MKKARKISLTVVRWTELPATNSQKADCHLHLLSALCMDYTWSKVRQLCRRKDRLPLLASLSAAAMKVVVPQADAELLVINKNGTRLIQNDGVGNTLLQLKQKKRRRAQTETSMLLEQTQLMLKLSDPLSSSKAMSLANTTSGVRISRLTRRPDKASFYH